MIYDLKELQENSAQLQAKINDKWVPVRPVNYKYRNLPERLKEAWAVFIGKADAFIWPEEQ